MKCRLLILFLLCAGCEKPNPVPELSDSIYQDLMSQAETTVKTVEGEKKKLEGLKHDMETAKPQTGDFKIAQRRFFESERKVQQLEQQHHFLVFKARSRKEWARNSYLKAFNEKKTWDLSEEQGQYAQYKKSTDIPKDWDSKRRMASYQKETGFGAKAEGSAEKNEPKGEKKE